MVPWINLVCLIIATKLFLYLYVKSVGPAAGRAILPEATINAGSVPLRQAKSWLLRQAQGRLGG